MHTHTTHTGTRALCTHTHAPFFRRIRFTEEKTNVIATVKLYLKYKFHAYLPASLFLPYSHFNSFIYHCFKFHLSNSNMKPETMRPLCMGRAYLLLEWGRVYFLLE